MGRSLNGFCQRGHHISGVNVIWRTGGHKGHLHRNCRKCYNERRKARLKERYANDEAFREKVKARANAFKQRKRQELQVEQQ